MISEKAADDLGVGTGDTLIVRHPVVGGRELFSLQDSELEVIGVHAHPFRLNAYLSAEHTGIIGIDGMTNVIHARPASGVETDTLKEDLFKLPGVGSVQKATASTDVFRDQFEQFTGILYFIQIAIMALAPADSLQHRQHQHGRTSTRTRHHVRLRAAGPAL